MRRLTPATLTLMMFGIVGLLIVGYVAKTILANSEKKPAPPSLRELPMAVSDIPAGTVITSDHLGMGRFPRSQLTSDMLLVNRVIVGRVARTPIKAAEPIKANMLYQPGELPDLEVGEGMRAVSIMVGDGVSMVDGMVKPGQYVDILFTAFGSNGVSDPTFQGGLTMRLFEGVKILAVNRNFTQSRVDRGDNHVTLELTEAQANIIVLARDRGTLTLTYNPTNSVGNGGVAATNAERVTLFEILGLKKSDPPKDPTKTEIYRGTSMQSNLFDERGRFLSGNGAGYGLGNPGVPGSWGGFSVYGGGGGYNYNPDGSDGNRSQYVLPNSYNGNGQGQGQGGQQNTPRSNGPAASNPAPQNNNFNAPRVPTAQLPSPNQN